MPEFIIVAGINGTGKSSLRGVLGEYKDLGHIIDPDQISKEQNADTISAGKIAVRMIDSCIQRKITFTQETTLFGNRIVKEMQLAKELGFKISMFYVGLESLGESLTRITNRVQKGGHGIPEEHVIRRYEKRITDFQKCVPYCDEIVFYDNQNGFVKVAEYKKETGFHYTNEHRPKWLQSLKAVLS